MAYMEGTKFELRHWDNPDHMHRTMLFNNVALTWHREGDPVNDPDNYTESFDLVDNHDPSNNRTGMTRAECDRLTLVPFWKPLGFIQGRKESCPQARKSSISTVLTKTV